MRASAQWRRRHFEWNATRNGRRGFVQLRNYSAEYLIAGSGEPMVLVPGIAGGFELLAPLVRVLSRQFQVITYQLRGERDLVLDRVPLALTDLASDLAELTEALLLERPIVLGVSFGGAIALEYALLSGHRCGPLVLQGVEAAFRAGLGGRIAQMALEHFPLPHNNAFFNQFFRLLFARREPIGPLLEFVTERCWSTDQSVVAQRLRMLTQFDVRARLEALKNLTLVVAGAEDAIIEPSAQRSLAATIPNARCVTIPTAGHLCCLTRPRTLARFIREFLDSNKTPATVRRAA